ARLLGFRVHPTRPAHQTPPFVEFSARTVFLRTPVDDDQCLSVDEPSAPTASKRHRKEVRR
ncbi:hypothetical protein, partial [Sinorhizobium meliloti]|uniref:hypothetical protein n=1 Tax=Rhizobium meliloti TaxID=382 RepID=UPI001AEC934F